MVNLAAWNCDTDPETGRVHITACASDLGLRPGQLPAALPNGRVMSLSDWTRRYHNGDLQSWSFNDGDTTYTIFND